MAAAIKELRDLFDAAKGNDVRQAEQAYDWSIKYCNFRNGANTNGIFLKAETVNVIAVKKAYVNSGELQFLLGEVYNQAEDQNPRKIALFQDYTVPKTPSKRSLKFVSYDDVRSDMASQPNHGLPVAIPDGTLVYVGDPKFAQDGTVSSSPSPCFTILGLKVSSSSPDTIRIIPSFLGGLPQIGASTSVTVSVATPDAIIPLNETTVNTYPGIVTGLKTLARALEGLALSRPLGSFDETKGQNGLEFVGGNLTGFHTSSGVFPFDLAGISDSTTKGHQHDMIEAWKMPYTYAYADKVNAKNRANALNATVLISYPPPVPPGVKITRDHLDNLARLLGFTLLDTVPSGTPPVTPPKTTPTRPPSPPPTRPPSPPPVVPPPVTTTPPGLTPDQIIADLRRQLGQQQAANNLLQSNFAIAQRDLLAKDAMIASLNQEVNRLTAALARAGTTPPPPPSPSAPPSPTPSTPPPSPPPSMVIPSAESFRELSSFTIPKDRPSATGRYMFYVLFYQQSKPLIPFASLRITKVGLTDNKDGFDIFAAHIRQDGVPNYDRLARGVDITESRTRGLVQLPTHVRVQFEFESGSHRDTSAGEFSYAPSTLNPNRKILSVEVNNTSSSHRGASVLGGPTNGKKGQCLLRLERTPNGYYSVSRIVCAYES